MTDLDYLREACRYAVQHSHDGHTNNGAVLVTSRRVVFSANVAPPGVSLAGRQDAPLKYAYIEHAERAVIYKAAAAGAATAGATLYCPWFACTDCARAIIMAGIKDVVGLMAHRQATPSRWSENVMLAERMLTEAGVGMRWLAGPVGLTMRFDGRDFSC
jgi:dCMP deaminase